MITTSENHQRVRYKIMRLIFCAFLTLNRYRTVNCFKYYKYCNINIPIGTFILAFTNLTAKMSHTNWRS